MRHAYVLLFIFMLPRHEAKQLKGQNRFTWININDLRQQIHQEVATMKPLNNDKSKLTPPDKLKTPAPTPRRSSNPSPASTLSKVSRRSSAPQCRSPSLSPPDAARKPSPPRPDWQRPPGKAYNSHSLTQIPVPVKPASARKMDGKRVRIPNVELTPPTPSNGSRRSSSTPKTPSPLLHQVDFLHVDYSPPTPSDPARRGPSMSIPCSPVVSRTSSTRTLIPRFRTLNLTAQTHVRPPTPTPRSSPPHTPTYKTRPESAISLSEHDSLSPFFNKDIFNHARHLSPTRPLPPSPSTLHPYISKTHISPSCTSGALTHRLLCGHLIATPKPSTCKKNCAIEIIGFEMARLKAQGFIRNCRDLDTCFICSICVEELVSGGGGIGERVEVLGKRFGGEGEGWTGKRKELTRMLGEGRREEVREFVVGLGVRCWAVLDAGLLGQTSSNDVGKSVDAEVKSTKGLFRRLTDRRMGLGIRI